MKFVTLLGAVGNLVFLSACTNPRHHMNNTDNLSGTWSCLSVTVDGKAVAKETTDLLRLTLTQNRYKTEKGEQVLFDSTYSLDPSKDPKQINIVGTEGDLAGKDALGIYALDGDILRMSYVMPGLPRPERFESPTGSKIFLATWKKEKQ